jgi:hypothetical protein
LKSAFYTPLLFATAAAFLPAEKLTMPVGIAALAATYPFVLDQEEGSAADILAPPAIAPLATTFAPSVVAATPQSLVMPSVAALAVTFAPTLLDAGDDINLVMPFVASLINMYLPTVKAYEVSSSDPLWSYVKFLGHFVGTNGQTTQSDVSSIGRTITMANGAKIDSTVTLFEENMGYKDASNDLVTAPHDANWWGQNDSFCIEGHFIFPSTLVTGLRMLAGKYRSVTNGRGCGLYLTTDANPFDASSDWKLVTFVQDTSSAGKSIISMKFQPEIGTRYHLAVSRDVGTGYWRLFVEGVMGAKELYTSNITTPSQAFSIGSQNDGSTHQQELRFREVRVTVGHPRYANDAGFVVPLFKFAQAA